MKFKRKMNMYHKYAVYLLIFRNNYSYLTVLIKLLDYMLKLIKIIHVNLIIPPYKNLNVKELKLKILQ